MRRLLPTSTVIATTLLLACADDGGSSGDEIGATEDGDSSDVTTGTSDESSSTGETTSNPDTGETTSNPDTGESSSETTDTDTTDTTETGDGDGDVMLTFIAMGDGGEGNAGQYAVANAVEMICADKGGCAFVLYLGDNFYDDGVSSAMDEQFQTKFELPYADLDMPFHIVLGNHDYGQLSFVWEKAAYEIEYTNYSDKWELPDVWYTLSYPGLDMFVMDTTRLMWNHETSAQQNWLDGQISASDAPWKIAMGHHPYYSNGEHGNAGNYEGFPFPPQLAGTTVKEVLDDSICGKVDLYLAGHDHNRQWNQQTCQGTSLIVSGGAAKTTEFAYHGGGNDVYWENDDTPGFLLIELSNTTMHTEFYNQDGMLEYERDIVK